jgi:hypothetical protein
MEEKFNLIKVSLNNYDFLLFITEVMTDITLHRIENENKGYGLNNSDLDFCYNCIEYSKNKILSNKQKAMLEKIMYKYRKQLLGIIFQNQFYVNELNKSIKKEVANEIL